MAFKTILNWSYLFLLKNTHTWSEQFKQHERAYNENSVPLP